MDRIKSVIDSLFELLVDQSDTKASFKKKRTTPDMGILIAQDKEKVKRAIPKASNKIIDATVARLYIAYPDRTQWTSTGLMGAVALVDDLVGHTFFLKLVDIRGTRGVVWDQELYVDFQYHQDRTFFHTFELDDCLAGLLFEDTHDAAHFFKRVTTRQKHASKQTANNKNAVALKERLAPEEVKKGTRGEFVNVTTGQRSRRARGVLYYDDQPPVEWRLLYNELAAAGISEDMIAENRQFIKDYIAQQGGPLVDLEPPIPRRFAGAGAAPSRTSSISTSYGASVPGTLSKKTKKAPPPPPPGTGSIPPSSVASSSPSPSYTVQPKHDLKIPTTAPHHDSAPASESEEEQPLVQKEEAESKPRFRLPPMNAPIPKVTNTVLPSAPQKSQLPFSTLPNAQNSVLPPLPQSVMSAPPLTQLRTGLTRPGPPPPPRAARPDFPPTPRSSSVLSANSAGGNSAGSAASPRVVGQAPPPPPSRVSRPVRTPNNVPQSMSQAPPQGPPSVQQHVLPPPPPPQRNYNVNQNTALVAAPTPPHFPALSQHTSNMLPSTYNPTNGGSGAPPPSPLPPVSAPQQPAQTLVLPPLPPVAAGASPPPPTPPSALGADADAGPAPPLPAAVSSRDALLASIIGSGIGTLKKTDKTKVETPSVLPQEPRGEPVAAHSTGGPAGGPAESGAGGQPETLADALASALNKRKNKVADSDDNDEHDDW